MAEHAIADQSDPNTGHEQEQTRQGASSVSASSGPSLPSTASTVSSRSPLPPVQSSNLPPLVTSSQQQQQQHQQQHQPVIPRTNSKAQRFSVFSAHSNSSNQPAHSLSRPQSIAFPYFHSSLTYALVRDFAYPAFHPLHYGPPPDQASGMSTPASDAHRRLSDPPPTWDGSRGQWSAGPWQSGQQLPTTSFDDGDGPPWSEDEDLHSPVVTSSKHRKHHKSGSSAGGDRGRRGRSLDREGAYTSTNGDGSETYYISDANESANGPGGEFVTYPAPSARAAEGLTVTTSRLRRDSHFAATLPNRSYDEDAAGEDDEDDSWDVDESRYSRDYQFTIASPDEEMHGKAVALFDFARENDNELPLIEGQVILVSYRHGQGWLVAQDPKTGESGLVPEEYVRLLRDIEGGWNGLMNGAVDADPGEAKTPTQESQPHFGNNGSNNGSSNNNSITSTSTSTSTSIRISTSTNTTNTNSNNSNTNNANNANNSNNNKNVSGDWYPPVVSTFSTSREDLEPWPHHKLGSSQVSTPTATASATFATLGEEDENSKSIDEATTPKETHVSAVDSATLKDPE